MENSQCQHENIYNSGFLIKEVLKENVQNGTIHINCTCNENLSFSLNQIYDILYSMNKNQLLKNSQVKPGICNSHKKGLSIYCRDCKTLICTFCTLRHTLHYEHNYLPIEDFTQELSEKFKNSNPKIEKFNLDRLEKDFISSFSQEVLSTLLDWDILIQQMQDLRTEYKAMIQEGFEKAYLKVRVIKLIYNMYYSLFNNSSTDINDLIFLSEASLKVPTVQINKGLAEQFQKIKNEMENLFKSIKAIHLDIEFSFKNWKSEEKLLKEEMSPSYKKKKINEYFSLGQKLTGHEDYVTALAMIKGGRIASGSGDKMIRIWSEHEKTFTCIQIISGHEQAITSLLGLKEGRLISGSEDKTIRIWNEINAKFSLIQTINAHSGGINSIISMPNYSIASGSDDKSIKIWKETQNKFNCTLQLSSHEDCVICLLFMNDGRLASGSSDKTIKIWNEYQYSFECSQTICGHLSGINSLTMLNDGKIASGSTDKSIRIWTENQHKFSCSQIIQGHQYRINSIITLDDGRIISGSVDNTIRVWCDLNKGNFSQMLSEHELSVNVLLKMDNGRIASGSADKSIIIWYY